MARSLRSLGLCTWYQGPGAVARYGRGKLDDLSHSSIKLGPPGESYLPFMIRGAVVLHTYPGSPPVNAVSPVVMAYRKSGGGNGSGSLSRHRNPSSDGGRKVQPATSSNSSRIVTAASSLSAR